MPPPASSLRLGQILDERYCLERILGQGGMGVVFAARHLELRELVAIKVLHGSAMTKTVQVDRFLREARLASRLKGDHAVRILDVVRSRGEIPPYIVMEYLEGEDLLSLLHSLGPLPPGLAVDYVLQACEAVAEAHRLGIVHRDLKPANLLLTQRPDGTPLVKVLDFGISKSEEKGEEGSLTTTTTFVGSPSYISPEQLRSAKTVDARADVWALGVILFELLSGKRPFVGDNQGAILAAVAADPPIELGTVAPTLPPDLQKAVGACLRKDREERVASVADLAKLLEPFASPFGRQSIDAIAGIATMPIPPSLLSLPDSPPSVPGEPSSASEISLAPVANPTESTRMVQAAVAAPPVASSSRAPWLTAAGAALVLVSVGATWTVATRQGRREPPVPAGARAAAPSDAAIVPSAGSASAAHEAVPPPTVATASAAPSASAAAHQARPQPLPITRTR